MLRGRHHHAGLRRSGRAGRRHLRPPAAVRPGRRRPAGAAGCRAVDAGTGAGPACWTTRGRPRGRPRGGRRPSARCLSNWRLVPPGRPRRGAATKPATDRSTTSSALLLGHAVQLDGHRAAGDVLGVHHARLADAGPFREDLADGGVLRVERDEAVADLSPHLPGCQRREASASRMHAAADVRNSHFMGCLCEGVYAPGEAGRPRPQLAGGVGRGPQPQAGLQADDLPDPERRVLAGQVARPADGRARRSRGARGAPGGRRRFPRPRGWWTSAGLPAPRCRRNPRSRATRGRPTGP